MKVCTCVLLFGIFDYTSSILRIGPKEDHRVVNLPQVTGREYSTEEYSGDTNNLDNAHNFRTRGTTVQDKNKNMKLVLQAPRVETLTDFVQTVVKILNTYEDSTFEDFFNVLDNEIRKYHYNGCKFSELTQNSDTKKFLVKSMKLIRGKSVSFTKANTNEVAAMLRDERYDKNVKELLDYINSLYRNNEQHFQSVLNELKYFRNTKSVRTHNNLVQVIRGGIRAVLFDPYTALNTHTRRELKERIETFWKKIKNKPTSSAEVNGIPNTDNSFKFSQNILNRVKNSEPYSKNDPHAKSKNESEIVSIETFGEQSQRDETEKDESGNESRKQITNDNTDEISSSQSFDSSSNSINNFQERQKVYNTQRYMTLYTERISYKAETTKKTEIIPISANVMTRRPIIEKRRSTTSTPRKNDVSSYTAEKIEILRANHETDDTKLVISNSSHDAASGLTLESKHKPRARENYDEQQKHGKAYESRPRSKQKNVEILCQYDAVIDVQLANTELLKSLRMSEPLGMDMKYETTLYPKSVIQTGPVPTKCTILPRTMRAETAIKPQKRTAVTKSRSRHSKRNKTFNGKHKSIIRRNIAHPLPITGHPTDQFMKEKNKNQKYLSRSDNNTIGLEDFNTYIIKRINAMEDEVNELKHRNDFSFGSKINNNNTYEVEVRNITDKFKAKYKVDSKRKDMKGNAIEILLNENHAFNNEEGNDEHEFTTRNTIMHTESPTNNTKSRKLNVIKKDAVNATNIDNNNITQVTNNINKLNVKVTKKLNEEVIYNNVTTSNISLVKVANATKLESVVTTPALGITRYYDSQQENRPTVHNSQFDPFFDHINDGIDLHM